MRQIPDPEADYYAANYRSYEAQNPSHKLDHYVSEVDKACNGNDEITLLDIGCGPGVFLAYASRLRPNWRLHGTDMRSEAVAVAADKLGDRAKIAVAPASARPFGSTKYDVITAWDVLEHLEDPAAVVSGLRSWLAPGGALIFVVPVYDGPLGPVVSLLDKDPTHLRKVGRDYWLNLAISHFSEISWHGVIRYLVTTNRYIHFPTRRLRRFTPAILVIGHTGQG
jgi:SAM-dependent methyltransferase